MTPGRRLALQAAYVACALAFLEGSSRLALSTDVLLRRVVRSPSSAAHRVFWVRHRSQTPWLSYRFDVYHPTRGWSLQRGLQDVSVFGGKTLNSSSGGLRGRAEHEYARPAGRARIAVFGDSFTFGEEVSDDETYAALLERELPGTEVLNFGVHGYGHDQMLLYLQEEGVRYHPDVVLLGFVYEDMERNLLDFRDYAKPRFEIDGDRLRLRCSPVPAPGVVVRAQARRSGFLDLWHIFGDALLWRTGRREQPMRRLAAALLAEFRRTAAEAGAQWVIFAYLPTHEELAGPPARLKERDAFFLDLCGSLAVPCVSVTPAFREAAGGSSSLNPARHWKPWEHQVAAKAIAAFLTPRLRPPPER